MISKLSISEFKSRLKYHTKEGDPQLKASPFMMFTIFTEMGKKYYGRYTDSYFELTINATFFPIPYLIAGNFKAKNKSETEVSYQVKRMWFGYLWVRIVPALFIVFVNYLLISNSPDLNIETILFTNLVLTVLFLPLLIIRIRRKQMLKDFRKTFVIEN